MTQRTINLYDGLEALYYFDPTYYDGTKGEIKDKSGHERHASAVGGPTIGTEGPDYFGATSFDNSDDYFRIRGSSLGTDGEQTTACLFKSDDTGDFNTIFANDNHVAKGIKIDVTDFENLRYVPKSVESAVDYYNTDVGEWYLVVATYDGTDTYRQFVDGELVGKMVDSTTYIAGTNDARIGREHFVDSRFFAGEIAFLGRWFRELSDAEISYLDRLTAPRRAQL